MALTQPVRHKCCCSTTSAEDNLLGLNNVPREQGPYDLRLKTHHFDVQARGFEFNKLPFKTLSLIYWLNQVKDQQKIKLGTWLFLSLKVKTQFLKYGKEHKSKNIQIFVGGF